MVIERIASGISPPKKKKKYVESDKIIQRIVEKYGEYKDNDNISGYDLLNITFSAIYQFQNTISVMTRDPVIDKYSCFSSLILSSSSDIVRRVVWDNVEEGSEQKRKPIRQDDKIRITYIQFLNSIRSNLKVTPKLILLTTPDRSVNDFAAKGRALILIQHTTGRAFVR
ncbi:hypothetical protein ANN_13175 [Periplaneta americana]|uniref:Uncharacterized protein n=1 Tax=Periplaneta americana TaxID=6978 RepID=A0ABQ8TKS7_PERAM|nr:hypothetical protein ANN_13175 [Periplaneta americana]